MMSDWDCLDRARKGDEASWQQIIDRHHPTLIKTTFLITGSMAAAQDLVQEVFTRLLRHRSRHNQGSFKAYLSTIAYRLALKENKRSLKHVTLERINPSDPNPTPLDNILKQERHRHLAYTINTLDEHHRDILVLRFYGNHSYQEIAAITNLPIGTVKSRIFYAVKACQQKMREKGIIE